MKTLIITVLTMSAACIIGTAPAPCATEDSTGCYWNAAARGNGVGRSFIDTPAGTVYLP